MEAVASEAVASKTVVFKTVVLITQAETQFDMNKGNCRFHGFSLLAVTAFFCNYSLGKRGDSPQGPSSKKLLV